jgi:hypothetical protein
MSAQADAGARIAYPTASQMYALLGSDVQVTYGTVQPPAPLAEPAPPADTGDQMPLLLPERHSLAVERILFEPSVRDYGMSPLDAAARLPVFEVRINEFWNIRQDVFPEQQRIRLRSVTDGMLTLSVGGSNGPGPSLSIDGGVAGALWTISRQ